MDAATVVSERSFDDLVVEIAGLDVDAGLQRLRVLEGRQRELDAERSVTLGVLEANKAFQRDAHASMFGVLRSKLGWSEAECRSRMRIARLVAAHPGAGEALYDARASVANIEAIARLFANPRLADRFDSVVGTLLVEAQRMEHDDFKRLPARWELLHDPGVQADRAEVAERRDAHLSIVDGQGTLLATFGDLDAARNREIFERFIQAEFDRDWKTTTARFGDDAKFALLPRTAAQRRADALTAIFTTAASTPAGSRAPKPVAVVHVDWHSAQDMLAIAGLIPERLANDPFEDPTPLISKLRCDTGDGELIAPTEVLKVLVDGYVHFVIHNDVGIPIKWGRQRRLFTGAARDAVMSLLTRCEIPGCRIKASHSQADHLTNYSDGGTTDPDNGGPGCDRHNITKHRKRWRVERDPHGHFHTYRPDGTEL